VNPILSLAVTYSVALVACLGALLVEWQSGVQLRSALRGLTWTSAVCGLAILSVEIGVLLSYRAGWAVRTLALVANTMVFLVLIPVGLLFFREEISGRQVFGALLCVVGLALLLK
jgi:uncharacterized membrane protein